MSVYKCKMCGGDLEAIEGASVAECEYCGTKQTIPKSTDENMQGFFNRANTLRIKSEFDKAEKLYEKIIQADPTQAEAYWGLILCKYGIDYVDDPATLKKIPTCHRVSFDSIVADDDYKSALEHADIHQRVIYEEQAREIDRIQREILSLAQKEETYDIFICYKETDANGMRTQDSVIANDIYYHLMQEGFKVFYAAITLEGKLGSAYEPIIFAALNSAKVMLVIGTKPEYFNAVWVKNEWSRFLKIIKKDRSKLLIPCYRDMDAYELPDEFAHLQAQDMSKIGFITDVVRGIKKILKKDEYKAAPKESLSASTATNSSVAPLLKRVFMFIEDGDWENADKYCEKVLDIDPENPQAYLGKLMVEMCVKKKEQLINCSTQFDSSNNYRKAIRFGDDALKNELVGYVDHIKERNRAARLESLYNEASKLMKNAGNDDNQYRVAGERFAQILDYKDSKKLSEECFEKSLAFQYEHILSALKNASSSNQFNNIADRFAQMGNYKDAPALSKKYYEKAKLKAIEEENAHRDSMYDHACELQRKDTIPMLRNAVSTFKSLQNWRDSEEHIRMCENRIDQLEKLDKIKSAFNPTITAAQSAAGTNYAASQAEKKKRLKKKRNRNIFWGIVCLCTSALALVSIYLFYKAYKYHQEMKNL